MEEVTKEMEQVEIIPKIHLLRSQINYLLSLANITRTFTKNMVEYDSAEEEFKIHNVITYSKEVTDSKTNLLLARLWLGVILNELGVGNPYNNDIHDKADIEYMEDNSSYTKDTDVSIGFSPLIFISFDKFDKFNNIERICKLRYLIDIIISDFKSISALQLISHINIYTYLMNARMMLGEELYRIKHTKNYVSA